MIHRLQALHRAREASKQHQDARRRPAWYTQPTKPRILRYTECSTGFREDKPLNHYRIVAVALLTLTLHGPGPDHSAHAKQWCRLRDYEQIVSPLSAESSRATRTRPPWQRGRASWRAREAAANSRGGEDHEMPHALRRAVKILGRVQRRHSGRPRSCADIRTTWMPRAEKIAILITASDVTAAVRSRYHRDREGRSPPDRREIERLLTTVVYTACPFPGPSLKQKPLTTPPAARTPGKGGQAFVDRLAFADAQIQLERVIA